MKDPEDKKEPLSPDEILTVEFEYIAQAAFQVNEDRTKVTTFYLITVGSFIAAILSSQLETLKTPLIHWAFAGLFVLLSAAGMLTLLHLVRLRQAWLDSVQAMNKIKEFYIQHVPEPKIESAFHWLKLPEKFKPWSISFLLALQVSLLGGVTLGAAILCAGLGFNNWWWDIAIGTGAFYIIFQIILYQQLLRD